MANAQRRRALHLCVLVVATNLPTTGALVISNGKNSLNGSVAIHNPASVAQDWYLLERVGFQESGAAQQPRSPHSHKSTCLTAGGPDRKGGLALGWDVCQDTAVVDKISNPQDLEAQSFRLNTDGSIQAKVSAKCVRRLECNEGGVSLGYIYDLGECNDDQNLKIKVDKAQANSIDRMRPMGYLANAVALEVCNLCGPYRLQNMCMGSTKCG